MSRSLDLQLAVKQNAIDLPPRGAVPKELPHLSTVHPKGVAVAVACKMDLPAPFWFVID